MGEWRREERCLGGWVGREINKISGCGRLMERLKEKGGNDN